MKSLLLRELFMSKFLENAKNEVFNDEESDVSDDEDKRWLQDLLISPKSLKKKYYEYFIAFIAMIDLIINIYWIFVGSPNLLFNLILLPFYLVAMYISAFTTYYVDLALERRAALVIARYLKTTFVIDFFSTIPFFLFSDSLLGFKLLRIILFSVYLMRINSFVDTMLSGYLHSRKELLMNIQKAMRFLILLIFTMHMFACIWIYIGRDYNDDGWVTVKASNLQNPEDNYVLYIAAIYWVMTTFTTVGYGDFSGSANSEYLFQMLTQFVGIGFFGYIIGNISSMIGQIDSVSELQEEEEEIQNLWIMKLGRVNKEKIFSSHFYDHINCFFLKYWNMDYHTLKENEFYNQLKPRLKIDIDNLWFEPVYERFEGFFRGLEHGFKRSIVHNLKFWEHRLFPPYNDRHKNDKRSFPESQKHLLLQKGSIPDKIFFVVGGEAYATNTTGRYYYFKLPDGSFFGETHVLAGIPLSYSIYYDEEIGCATLEIDTETFLNICREYPDSFNRLRFISEKRRKMLKIYKYEALDDIIKLSLEKLQESDNYSVFFNEIN